MTDIEIDVSDQQTRLAVPAEWLRQIVERVLSDEGVTFAEISVALVDDPTIHRINRDFLGHDFPTDVISFVLNDHSHEAHDLTGTTATASPSRRRLEGELVVSTDTAIREATAHGWSAQDELLLYIVHGLLHLCGYDDLTDEARPLMRERERQVLDYWRLTPSGLEA